MGKQIAGHAFVWSNQILKGTHFALLTKNLFPCEKDTQKENSIQNNYHG